MGSCTEWTLGNVCLVCEYAAFELRSELEKWTVSSTDERLVGEDEKPKISFSISLPDWTCIVCKNDIIPPVFQCHNGHLACTLCSEKRVHCTACPGSINRIKNVALDSIINSAVVSCKYAKLGCTEKSSFMSRYSHEKTCSFAPMNCTMPGCSQAGYKHLFEQHLKSKHNYDQILDLDVYASAVEQYTLKVNVYLNSSNSEVLLRHKNGNDSYLLHQHSTDLGEILHITSLENSRKRKYAIDVEVSEEQTYCYKSMCTSTQQHGGLLVPKQPGGAPLMKMLCRIRLS